MFLMKIVKVYQEFAVVFLISNDLYFSFTFNVDCVNVSSICADNSLESSDVAFEATLFRFQTCHMLLLPFLDQCFLGRLE